MKYIPCFKCNMRVGCEALKSAVKARAQLSKKHRVMVITSMRIRCRKYEDQFAPGQRVSFTVQDQSSSEDSYLSTVDAMGTVMGYSAQKTKFIIWVDEESIDDGVSHSIIHLDPRRRNALAEPKVSICPECGKPKGARIPGREWTCNTCSKPWDRK
jgi:hypothetical protein